MDPNLVRILGVTVAFWLLGNVASLLVLRWNLASPPRRTVASWILAVMASVIAGLGLAFVHFTYSETVNGSGWSLNSFWFFLTSAILAGLAVILMLARRLGLGRAKPAVLAAGNP